MRSTEPRIAATGVGQRSLIARGLLVNYASLGVSLLSMLILTPVLLRSLGPGAYGFWAILGSLSSYFVLLDFGMNTAVAKYTAEYRATDQRARLSATVSTILALVVAVGVVATGVSLALAASVPRIFGLVGELARGGAVAFVVTVLTVGTLLIGGVLGNVIYGWQRVDLFKAFGIAQVAANFVLTVALLRAGTGIIGVAVAGLASSAILIVLHMVFLRRSGYGVVVSPRLVRLETLKDVAAFSVRTFVLGVSARALYYSDYLVIGILLGAAEVAPYEVAYKLCFLSTYVFSVISTTMFPRFAALHAVGDMASLAGLYLRLAKASLLLMMPVGLFLAFYGEPIIALWVGPAAFAGTGVLLVLVVMNVFHAVGTQRAEPGADVRGDSERGGERRPVGCPGLAPRHRGCRDRDAGGARPHDLVGRATPTVPTDGALGADISEAKRGAPDRRRSADRGGVVVADADARARPRRDGPR